jgi:hypothetical protein
LTIVEVNSPVPENVTVGGTIGKISLRLKSGTEGLGIVLIVLKKVFNVERLELPTFEVTLYSTFSIAGGFPA